MGCPAPPKVPGSPVSVKVWGPWACFTRPEFSTERVSYPVMTPTAAVGVLESIFWHPQFKWRPVAIDVLEPIKWMRLLRNEINKRQTASQARKWLSEGSWGLDIADTEVRDQRHTLLLRDVAYVVHAEVEVVDGDADPAKYRDQFRRRVARGQNFAQPYLGCREFLAYFAEPRPEEKPRDLNLDLGKILLRIERDDRGRALGTYFFDARLDHGRLVVPQEGAN